MEYVVHILNFIGIYIILGISYNILIGYAGLFSMAQAAFYGVGAYIAALLAVKLGFHFSLAMVFAVAGTMLVSFLLALPTLRVKGDYLVIATFGFQILIINILLNWASLTGGAAGLKKIPSPTLFGYVIDSVYADFVLISLFTLLIIWVASRILNSPFGLILKGIREDETAALALGKNVLKFKIWASMVSGGMAAIAGALYAYYIAFIDPTTFTLEETVFILSIVIVGGAGRIQGSIVGAVILVLFPELFKFLSLPESFAAPFRQVLYGVLLIVFMMFRPQGIIGERSRE
jgi:branched-chain amino acid transport system permease protein